MRQQKAFGEFLSVFLVRIELPRRGQQDASDLSHGEPPMGLIRLKVLGILKRIWFKASVPFRFRSLALAFALLHGKAKSSRERVLIRRSELGGAPLLLFNNRCSSLTPRKVTRRQSFRPRFILVFSLCYLPKISEAGAIFGISPFLRPS